MAKKNRPKRTKGAVGGLIGRSDGGIIENCYAGGKIIINSNPENVDIGGLIGQSENTKIVNSSADVKVEFRNKTGPDDSIMEVPKECKMPDLSGLDYPLLNRLILQLLIGDPGFSRKAGLYRRNFIRLLDTALREYSLARESVVADIEENKRPEKEMEQEGRFLYLLAFPDHMEICLNSISRLFKLLERMKSEKESPALPRDTRRLLETKYSSIVSIRNAIEHMDKLIHEDELRPGYPIMLAIKDNGESIAISENKLSLNDLALVLKNMHEMALFILNIKKV